MRLQQFSIKHLPMDEIPTQAPFMIVYAEGQAKWSYLPEHGETKVITHQGKVKRVRFEEGEDF